MYRISSFLLVPAMLLLLKVSASAAAWPFAENTLVCVGENAPQAERQAAVTIAAELQAAGGPQDNLLTAEELNNDSLKAGTHHIIAVGTWSDNVIARKTWGHWVMTAAQRDAIKRDFSRAREGHPEDMLTPQDDDDWRWTGDFNAFGFGQFTGSVGYIEPGRNFYSLQLVPNGLSVAPKEVDKIEKLFIIRITGNNAAGVARAAEAFIEKGMLHGILPAEGMVLPADWTPLALGKPQITTDLPAWTSPLTHLKDVHYAGWCQGYALQYAGFTEATQVEPTRICRMKFITPDGFDSYESFLTARASGNELLIAQVTDAQAAANAIDKLKKNSGGSEWKTYAVGTWQGYRSKEGFTFLHRDNFVLGESLPAKFDEQVLNALGAQQ